MTTLVITAAAAVTALTAATAAAGPALTPTTASRLVLAFRLFLLSLS
jgi:hypothetical protein